MNFPQKEKYTAEDLVSIVEILRAPGGCPWDAEQTHESLRRCLMEECCEVLGQGADARLHPQESAGGDV